MQTVIQHFEKTESLRSQNRELQTTAHQHLHMWKNPKEQKARLSNSYNHLQVEAFMDIERQWDILMKEENDRATQLSHSYERELEILKANVVSLKSTCKHIIRQRQQEAKAAKEKLEVCRAQIGMGETINKALVTKHRLRFNTKIEETLVSSLGLYPSQLTK